MNDSDHSIIKRRHTKKLSRRSFLRTGVAAACTLALPGAAAARSDGHEPLATLLDIRKCVACGACVEACREVNAHKFPKPEKPFPEMFPSRVPVMDWTDRQDVSDRLTPYNWLYVDSVSISINGQETEINIPRRCMHCVNPPCVKLCPWGAARQLDNGISRIDDGLCLGGAKCKTVCPWKIPERQTGVGLYLDLLPSLAGNGVMYKCDRCYDRIAKGDLPACIEACPENVQFLGPREEIIQKARKLAGKINGHVYGETENGGTTTIYVSPVRFEELGRVMETGPGRPHLNPVEDTMARANMLGMAMLLAPVAGIAAAMGKFFRMTKKIK